MAFYAAIPARYDIADLQVSQQGVEVGGVATRVHRVLFPVRFTVPPGLHYIRTSWEDLGVHRITVENDPGQEVTIHFYDSETAEEREGQPSDYRIGVMLVDKDETWVFHTSMTEEDTDNMFVKNPLAVPVEVTFWCVCYARIPEHGPPSMVYPYPMFKGILEQVVTTMESN